MITTHKTIPGLSVVLKMSDPGRIALFLFWDIIIFVPAFILISNNLSEAYNYN
jgi:hypothetical protein